MFLSILHNYESNRNQLTGWLFSKAPYNVSLEQTTGEVKNTALEQVWGRFVKNGRYTAVALTHEY